MMNYKRILVIVAAFFVFVSFPARDVLGQTSSAPALKEKICQKIVSVSENVLQQFAVREAKLQGQISERLSNVASRLEAVDERIQERRLRWDENRNNHFAKIEEKIQNNSQQQALTQFKEKIEKAIADRRLKIDEARKDFRNGFEQILQSRKQAVQEAVSGYETSLKEAYDKAEEECKNGTILQTIKDSLKKGLKDARDGYQNIRSQFTKFSDLVVPLVNARNEAIKKAQEEFRTILGAAQKELKAALGK